MPGFSKYRTGGAEALAIPCWYYRQPSEAKFSISTGLNGLPWNTSSSSMSCRLLIRETWLGRLPTEPGQLFQPEAETAVPPRKSPVDCQGIVLTDPSCWASAYNEELRLWAQHGNVGSNFTLHSYEWCLKTETLRAVSRSCEKQFVPVRAQTACQACLSDDLIKSCLRCVVRFAKKFWMAKLLRARLYGADGEETALAEDVQNTALFRMHGEQMKAVMQLKTDELQAWVRRRFSNRGGMSLNAPYEHLLAAVVQPCLQARWHAV